MIDVCLCRLNAANSVIVLICACKLHVCEINGNIITNILLCKVCLCGGGVNGYIIARYLADDFCGCFVKRCFRIAVISAVRHLKATYGNIFLCDCEVRSSAVNCIRRFKRYLYGVSPCFYGFCCGFRIGCAAFAHIGNFYCGINRAGGLCVARCRKRFTVGAAALRKSRQSCGRFGSYIDRYINICRIFIIACSVCVICLKGLHSGSVHNCRVVNPSPAACERNGCKRFTLHTA